MRGKPSKVQNPKTKTNCCQSNVVWILLRIPNRVCFIVDSTFGQMNFLPSVADLCDQTSYLDHHSVLIPPWNSRCFTGLKPGNNSIVCSTRTLLSAGVTAEVTVSENHHRTTVLALKASHKLSALLADTELTFTTVVTPKLSVILSHCCLGP